jgi:hypothetical protein
MRTRKLLVLLMLLGSVSAATAYGGAATRNGPYTRGATARCLTDEHVQVHEGTATSLTGNYPDLTFRYQGSELTIAFLPTESSGGVLGQAISSAFGRVGAALQYAGNAVYFGGASGLSTGEAKLITGCLY